MSTIRPEYYQCSALSNCDLTKEIIGIRTDKKGNHEIVILSKENDVTIKQKFLRCFGAGKLAHTETDLLKVASLLTQYNWGDCATQFRNDSAEYKAYRKICMFANKVLLSKGEATLVNFVGQKLKIENITLKQIKQNRESFYGIKLNNILSWNPEMQYKHINAQLEQIFQNSKATTGWDGYEDSIIPENDTVVAFDKFSALTFQVEQRLK